MPVVTCWVEEGRVLWHSGGVEDKRWSKGFRPGQALYFEWTGSHWRDLGEWVQRSGCCVGQGWA